MSLAAISANMVVAYAYSSDTIKVGNDPKDVAVNPKTNMAYVANFDNVVVIDGSTNNIVAKIPIGADANGWAIDVNPNTNRAYVAANSADSVIVIDTSQNKVITTIPVGNDPEGVAVNPETNMIYLANTHNSDSPDSISVIDVLATR
jgi:YVTN family beta-propeller protein